MTTERSSDLVRYSSPFGSPATMTRGEAERYERRDDRLYMDLLEIGSLTEEQRRHGPPHIIVQSARR